MEKEQASRGNINISTSTNMKLFVFVSNKHGERTGIKRKYQHINIDKYEAIFVCYQKKSLFLKKKIIVN